MKKAIVVFLVIVLVLSACDQRNTLQKNELSEPLYEFFSLSVHFKDGNYYICDGFGEIAEEYLVFSKERKIIKKVNLDIKLLNPNKVATPDSLCSFLGMNTVELEKALGSYHFDLGSGLHKPSYITSDAHLITFVVFSDEVAIVSKTDLLTGYEEEYQ